MLPGWWPRDTYGVPASLFSDMVNDRHGVYLNGIFYVMTFEQLWAASLSTPVMTYTKSDGTIGYTVANQKPYIAGQRGALLGAERTEQLIYSQEADSVWWSKQGGSSYAPNVATAPDATLTADKMVVGAGPSSSAQQLQTVSYTNGDAYVASRWFKAQEYSWAKIGYHSTVGSQAAYFNLSNGTIGSLVGSPVHYGMVPYADGWWRCFMIATATATTSVPVYFAVGPADGFTNFTGDGVSGGLAWGANFQKGASLSAYIPTTSAQVTRLTHNVAHTLEDWFSLAAGATIDVEFSWPDKGVAAPNASGCLAQLVASSSNYWSLMADNASGFAGRLTGRSVSNSASTVTLSSLDIAIGDASGKKLAGAFASNDMAALGGGGTLRTATPALPLVTPTTLQLGRLSHLPPNADIAMSKITVWGSRRPNDALAAMVA